MCYKTQGHYKTSDLSRILNTHFGTLLEPIVRKEFMERTGIKVRQKHMLLQSEEHPFMFADLDGVINEDGQLCIFEAKTASAYKQEVWEEEVPAASADERRERLRVMMNVFFMRLLF